MMCSLLSVFDEYARGHSLYSYYRIFARALKGVEFKRCMNMSQLSLFVPEVRLRAGVLRAAAGALPAFSVVPAGLRFAVVFAFVEAFFFVVAISATSYNKIFCRSSLGDCNRLSVRITTSVEEVLLC